MRHGFGLYDIRSRRQNMNSRSHCKPPRRDVARLLACLLAALWILCLAMVGPAEAQSQPAVGRIWGSDVTVTGVTTRSSGRAAGVPVLSGDVVTVHSGDGRMDLTDSGTIGICGPAQFTMLESEGAATIALQFGRLHVLVSSTAPFSIYTPFFQVALQSIESGLRNATIGLDPSGRFCVRATRGGILLNQQLTGESLTVPEPREIFLEGGSIRPLRKVAAACSCDVTIVQAPPSSPSPNSPQLPNPTTSSTPNPGAGNSPPTVSPAVPPQLAKPQAHKTANQKPEVPNTQNDEGRSGTTRPSEGVSREFGVPGQQQSSTFSVASTPVTAPPPEWRVLMPPLTFDAKSPAQSPDSLVARVLLVREVRVRPEVLFHGRVTTAETKQQEKIHVAPASPVPAKEGFWSRLKHLLTSSS
jgi:hypothetical protein